MAASGRPPLCSARREALRTLSAAAPQGECRASAPGWSSPQPGIRVGGRNADAFLENSVTRDYEDSIRERYRPSQGRRMQPASDRPSCRCSPVLVRPKSFPKQGRGLNAAQAISAGERRPGAVRPPGGGQRGQPGESGRGGHRAGAGLWRGLRGPWRQPLRASRAVFQPGRRQGEEDCRGGQGKPLVSRALDIAGEGRRGRRFPPSSPPICSGPFMTRTPPTPRRRRLHRARSWAAVAAGVLQGGLELPGTISDIYSTRRSIGSNAGDRGQGPGNG